MRFVDQTKIFIKSGDGGNGCVSFRREKYVEFGGPNGGDGGRGGQIYAEVVPGLNTLLDYRYQRHFKARKGQSGMGSNMTGAHGEDIILKLPVGTQIFDESEEFLIADLTEVGQKILLARGGDGGFGNSRFKSSITQAPRRATPGHLGEEHWLVLRLKLMADAGLLGLPNAGKSTFLSVVTSAKPKIADYPFTTLAPQLGVVGYKSHEFVVADIPGLIEGASEGLGLGHRFLGHVERCGILLHLIDGTSDDVVEDYHIIMGELAEYGGGLVDKPILIGLNKIDALDADERKKKQKALEKASKKPVHLLSGVTREGIDPILGALWDVVKVERDKRAAAELEASPLAKAKATDSWSPL